MRIACPAATIRRAAGRSCGRRAMVLTLTASLLGGLSGVRVSAQELDSDRAAAADFFEARIRPLLIEHCFDCHSGDRDSASGMFRMDVPSGLRAGGSRGAAVVHGADQRIDMEASLLWRAVGYQEPDLAMPPDGRLSDEQLADLKQWLEMGAFDPRPEDPTAVIAAILSIEQRSAEHWAFQRPQRPMWPPGAGSPLSDSPKRSAANPIDAFVLSRLAAAGLDPNPVADRRTLIRRLYHDLLGLPPTRQQIERFEADRAPDAYARLVDRLLDTPQYGERMARRWMDITRYADTKGYVFTEDRNYPAAYRYRNWLISAFNGDLAYDWFIRYQVAGDRHDPLNERGHLDAMGMLTLGRRFLNNAHDIADDRIDVVTRGVMGLTVSCARCHDHKYDPVSIGDYYALHSVFVNSEEPNDEPSPLRLVDKAKIAPAVVFLRGNPGNRGPEVPRRFVSFLTDPQVPDFSDGSGRGELAEKLVAEDNPLTARVIVNRLWYWLYGSGLVDTPSDFGLRSDPPSHPALLDYLAVELVESDWSLKRMVRLMVLSEAYQRSVAHRPQAAELDPENRLLWRANRRRLDFESYQDALLVASGHLQQQVGGPSVAISHQRPANRRAVYSFIDRQNLPGLFRAFDFASPDTHVPSRPTTTVPQQGLYALNAPAVAQLSQRLGERARQLVEHADPAGEDSQTASSRFDASVDWLFSQVLARAPSAAEREAAIEFVVGTEQHWRSDFVPLPWSWGHGRLSPQLDRLLDFEPLPYVTKGQWQGSDQLPDPRLGWVTLSAEGGHPGRGLDLVAVRRWRAPQAGRIRIAGKLVHEAADGDGVRGTVLLDQDRRLGQWAVHEGETRTQVKPLAIEAGQVIDFVTDSVGDESHDSFKWTVRIEYLEGGPTFASRDGQRDTQPLRLTAWGQLAQALLASNEFVFVD
jgi:hypothetical protein